MKKIELLLIALIIGSTFVRAQTINLKNGQTTFKLEAPAGSLSATNKNVSGQIDPSDGTFVINVDVRAFKFDSEVMPVRINDYTSQRFHLYYMQSEQFPDAAYRGKVLNRNAIQWTKNGVYKVKTSGSLTIHGQTKEAEIPVVIVIKDGVARMESTFTVATKDYGVRLPSSVSGTFFRDIEVHVTAGLERNKTTN